MQCSFLNTFATPILRLRSAYATPMLQKWEKCALSRSFLTLRATPSAATAAFVNHYILGSPCFSLSSPMLAPCYAVEPAHARKRKIILHFAFCFYLSFSVNPGRINRNNEYYLILSNYWVNFLWEDHGKVDFPLRPSS